MHDEGASDRPARRRRAESDREAFQLVRRSWRKVTRNPDGTTTTYCGTASTWSAVYRANGRRVRVALGTADRKAATMKAAALVRASLAAERGDPFAAHRRTPIADHVAAFADSLEARGVVARYREDTLTCVRRFVGHASAATLAEVTVDRAERWLTSLRRERYVEPDDGADGPRTPSRRRHGRDRLSARSVERHRVALRAFARWAVESGRLPADPLATLAASRATEDPVVVRRALGPVELARLLAAARSRPLADARAAAAHEAARRAAGEAPRRGVGAEVSEAVAARLLATGEARALAYALIAATGLRRGEAERLTWGDLDLEAGILTVRASSAKARRVQHLPLRSDLAAALVAERRRRPSEGPADVVLRSGVPIVETLAADLRAAGIPATDEAGRRVDVPALRGSFVSALAAGGVAPETARRLARHASYATTAKHYVDPAVLELRAAVESARLPSFWLDSGPVLAPETAAECRFLPPGEGSARGSEGAGRHSENRTPGASGVRSAKMVGGEGFEPPKAVPPDLQSGPVDRFGTRPGTRDAPVRGDRASDERYRIARAMRSPGTSAGPARRRTWSRRQGLNLRPSVYKTDALPLSYAGPRRPSVAGRPPRASGVSRRRGRAPRRAARAPRAPRGPRRGGRRRNAGAPRGRARARRPPPRRPPARAPP